MYKASWIKGIKSSPRKLLIPVIVTIQLILNTSVGAAFIIPDHAGTIPYGISIDGIKVGGLSQNKAAALLQQNRDNIYLDRDITVTSGSKEWSASARDFDMRYDYPATIETVLADSSWPDGLQKFLALIKLQARPMEIPAEISWNHDRIYDFLNNVNADIMISARNAGFSLENGTIVISPEQYGEEIDIDSTADRIIQSLRLNQSNAIEIATREIMPAITAEDLQMVDCELASFTTEMDISNLNRNNNILLASELLNGTVIMPGEVMSFNEVVGERTMDNGFRSAPVIVSGSVHQDIGGGICQLATNLFNVSLLVGLDIVERSPHSIPVKYVPHGQDATVFYGQIDLKLRNNLSGPVVICSKAENQYLKVSIYGNHLDKSGTYVPALSIR